MSVTEAIDLARRGRELLRPPPHNIRTNLFRVVLVACCGFAAISVFDSLRKGEWAEALPMAAAVGVYYGGLAGLTMLPGAAVQLICLSAVARRTGSKTARRIAAIALSPLLGVGMYFAFESSVESRSKLLATALSLSIVYGILVRVPERGR